MRHREGGVSIVDGERESVDLRVRSRCFHSNKLVPWEVSGCKGYRGNIDRIWNKSEKRSFWVLTSAIPPTMGEEEKNSFGKST